MLAQGCRRDEYYGLQIYWFPTEQWHEFFMSQVPSFSNSLFLWRNNVIKKSVALLTIEDHPRKLWFRYRNIFAGYSLNILFFHIIIPVV